MPRPDDPTRTDDLGLTLRESQIMTILWDLGTATADQVREALDDRPHDSTVRTMLRVLEEKGVVTHSVDGRTFIYRPIVERSRAQASAVRGLLQRLFDGSAEQLLVRLVEDRQLTPRQLERLADRLRPQKPRRARSHGRRRDE